MSLDGVRQRNKKWGTVNAFTIREATEADAEGIAAVLRDITELRVVVNGTAEETRARVAGGLAVAVASPESVPLVAVGEDGAIAGYCSVHWVPFLFLRRPEGYISELFVRQSARGAGVGTALVEEVRRRAEAMGCSRLSLLNGKDSAAFSRGFYANRGWQARERMMNFIFLMDGK